MHTCVCVIEQSKLTVKLHRSTIAVPQTNATPPPLTRDWKTSLRLWSLLPDPLHSCPHLCDPVSHSDAGCFQFQCRNLPMAAAPYQSVELFQFRMGHIHARTGDHFRAELQCVFSGVRIDAPATQQIRLRNVIRHLIHMERLQRHCDERDTSALHQTAQSRGNSVVC